MAKCKVEAGSSVRRWDGDLSASQCSEFPADTFIGQGSFATAYTHAKDDKKVVKFTADERDAKAARRFVGKDIDGVVGVYDVKKLKGQTGDAPVVTPGTYPTDRQFSLGVGVPIYGMAVERVGQLSQVQNAAVQAFWGEYREARKYTRDMKPSEFNLADIGMDEGVTTSDCADLLKSAPAYKKLPAPLRGEACKKTVAAAYRAVESMAKNGVIPLDLHQGNWGDSEDKGLVIIDFGVSVDDDAAPKIDELAGVKRPKKGRKDMAKSKRGKRHNRLGAFGDSQPNYGLIAIGLAAVGAAVYLLWPKSAKAETAKKKTDAAPNVPTPAPSAGSTTTTPGVNQQFKDEATGVTIDGPSTPIAPQNQTYALKRGESWSNIASRTYGDYRWWPYLWDANRMGTQFQNPDRVNVGDVIVIAPMPPDDAAFKAAVFARADAHRKFWLRGRRGSLPAMVYEKTPLPSQLMSSYDGGFSSEQNFSA